MNIQSVRLSAFTAMLLAGAVNAAELPGGAQAGGALPQLRDEAEPFVYPVIEQPADTRPVSPMGEPGAPRMLLKGFRLHGIKDRPEHDISLDRIRRLIASETSAMIPEGAERLFTVAMFERIAQAITRYYRERGYFLARAYVPEQKVKDGIVKLQVVETRLEQIVFDGNELYDDSTMLVLLEDLVGKPAYLEDIEQALIKLNEYPGLTASAVFGPGSEPGTSAAVIRAVEQSTFDALSYDNYGSAYTGENRILYRHRNHNLFGNADLLVFNLMSSFSPANNQYFDLGYVQPIYKSLFTTGGGIKYNQFRVGQELEDLDINGESFVLNGFIDFDLFHTRRDRLTFLADLSLKQATSKVVNTVQAEDKLTVIRLDAVYAGLDRWFWPARHEAYFSMSIGLPELLGSMDSSGDGNSSRRGGSGATAVSAGTLAGGDFLKFNLGYSRLQPTFDLQSLLFRFDMQISSDLLTSLEQFSLGGPYSVRAYPTAQILVDSAIFTSFEYILIASPEIEQTWLNKLQLSVYFDFARGDINDPILNSAASATLSGIGVGVQMEPFNKVRVRLDLATATGDEPADLQDLPFYLSLDYRF